MSTATEDTYTPHASSTDALQRAQLALVDAGTELAKIDLRSLKGDLRTEVRAARDAVQTALKISRR